MWVRQNRLPHKSIIPILLRYDIDPLHISGEKLKAMFHQHGSFEELEIQVKKHHMKSREDAKTGGWYTKHALEFKEGWSKQGPQFCLCSSCMHARLPSYVFLKLPIIQLFPVLIPLRSMIQKALDWGRKTNNLRVNPIHGEEEIRMILSETFYHKELHQEETNREGGMVVQDRFASLRILLKCYPAIPYEPICYLIYFINMPWVIYARNIRKLFPPYISRQDESGSMMDSALPDINDANADFLLPPKATAGRESSSTPSAPNASGIMSFKQGSQVVLSNAQSHYNGALKLIYIVASWWGLIC